MYNILKRVKITKNCFKNLLDNSLKKYVLPIFPNISTFVVEQLLKAVEAKIVKNRDFI